MTTPTLIDGNRWPYPAGTYVRRVLWHCVRLSLWQIAWCRCSPLRPLLLRLFGAKTSLRSGFSRSTRVEMPWLLTVGRECSIGPGVTIYNLDHVRIGDFTVISQDAYLCGGTHDYTDSTYPLLRKPITIGDWVWIGAGAFIGPGVTIGEGAVVAARAVVVKDVAPWTVVGGNPAHRIKERLLKGIHPA